MVVVLMGVSGTGETIGKALAAELGWAFVEADDFHPAANIEKMRGEIALNDADRGSGSEGHYMDPGLLQSQFKALERPKDAIQIDITPTPEVIAIEIRRRLEV